MCCKVKHAFWEKINADNFSIWQCTTQNQLKYFQNPLLL